MLTATMSFAATKTPTKRMFFHEPLPTDKYSYVVVLGADTTVNIPDSSFYKISRKVIFKVNKYEIPDTSDFRRDLREELMPYMNEREYRLKSIVIRGAASPEGPYRWNVFLAKHRAQALVDLINSYSTLPAKEKMATVEVAEDYQYLAMTMKERGDKDYSRVNALVEEYFPADLKTLKRKLQRMDRGKLWRRLLKEYYPEMRAARVVLVFERYVTLTTRPLESTTAAQTEQLEIPEEVKLDTLTPVMPRRELLSVKTNVLHDLAYMPGYNRWCPIPNVAVEYYPLHGHFTFGASVDFPWWQHYRDHKYFQIRNYQLEARYYLRSGDVRERGYGNGAAFSGWYAQAYAQAAIYNVCFDADRGWEGEGIGGGLGFGYVMPLSKNGHWRLELGAQFGLFWTKHDPYQWLCPVDGDAEGEKYFYKWTGDADDFSTRQHRFTWIGPTRLNVTISYDLLYRKRFKGGASFRNKE